MEITAEKRVGRRILHHIRTLAIPRLAGTPGERKAHDYIRDSFLFSGHEVIDHEFSFSPTASDTIPRLGITIICSLVLAAYLLLPALPILSLELCLLSLLLMLFSLHWNRTTEKLLDRLHHPTSSSRNIIALHPARTGTLNVIFTAHYDSKSQTYSAPTRVLLYLALSLTVLLAAALIIVTSLTGWNSTQILIVLIPMTICAIAIQCNTTGNASPGACDNASGVGVLLELAHAFAGSNPSVNIAYIATGAEEMGLCGARILAQEEQFREMFQPNRTIIINLDTVGLDNTIRVINRYGIPPRQTGSLLTLLCSRVGERFGIVVKPGWIPTGALLDHIPFSSNGYQSVTLTTAGWTKAFRSIHTHKDSTEIISITVLEQIFAISQEIIDSIHMTRSTILSN